MSIIEQAITAAKSDFYMVAEERDRRIIRKFLLNALDVPRELRELWLTRLPAFVLPDVERSIKNVRFVNNRMTRDLHVVVPKGYVGRSNVSHRKPKVNA